MAGESPIPLLRRTLQKLSTDPEAIDWQERLRRARLLMEAFNAGGAVAEREPVLTPLLNLLAGDPKWEVRKAIADDLHLIRQMDYEPLAEKLCRDDNSFVRKAAEASRKRRRKARMALKQKLQGIELVLEQYQWLKETREHVAPFAAEVLGGLGEVVRLVHRHRQSLGPEAGRGVHDRQIGPRFVPARHGRRVDGQFLRIQGERIHRQGARLGDDGDALGHQLHELLDRLVLARVELDARDVPLLLAQRGRDDCAGHDELQRPLGSGSLDLRLHHRFHLNVCICPPSQREPQLALVGLVDLHRL